MCSATQNSPRCKSDAVKCARAHLVHVEVRAVARDNGCRRVAVVVALWRQRVVRDAAVVPVVQHYARGRLRRQTNTRQAFLSGQLDRPVGSWAIQEEMQIGCKFSNNTRQHGRAHLQLSQLRRGVPSLSCQPTKSASVRCCPATVGFRRCL